MVNPKKLQIVQELTGKLKRAKALVLIDYTGLSVPQQRALRNKLKEAGGEFTVVKNTLLKLAFQNYQLPITNYQLQGPTATVFAFEDEIASIKTLVEFSQEFELPKIKIGFFAGKMIEKEEILALAKIPTKKELRTQLVYTLNGPICRSVNVLKGNIRKLINLMRAIRN